MTEERHEREREERRRFKFNGELRPERGGPREGAVRSPGEVWRKKRTSGRREYDEEILEREGWLERRLHRQEVEFHRQMAGMSERWTSRAEEPGRDRRGAGAAAPGERHEERGGGGKEERRRSRASPKTRPVFW